MSVDVRKASPTENAGGFVRRLEAQILSSYYNVAAFACLCYLLVASIAGAILYVMDLPYITVLLYVFPAATFTGGVVFGMFNTVRRILEGTIRFIEED